MKLPKIIGKGEVGIKYELKEELKYSKIMNEQLSLLEGYKEIIKINKKSIKMKLQLVMEKK